MAFTRASTLVLSAVFAVSVLASPYWYDDYSYYDLYDEYNVYNMHYKLDDLDHDYLDWDLGNDELEEHASSYKPTKPVKSSASTSEVDVEDDYFGEQEHPYFAYYDDIYGDYFFDDPFEMDIDCTLDEDGSPKLEGLPACDISLEGADKVLTLLDGGIDGVYKVVTCQHGRPMYQRQNSPPNEDRVLWYSSKFKDWDINNGSKPNEDDIIVYGGQGDSEMRPQFVAQNHWHVASDLSQGYTGKEDYIATELTLKCSDGTEIEKPVSSNTWGARPLLTDNEMENQYAVVYKRAAKNAARNDDINLGLVSLFVFVGLAIIFGLPFMVARTRKQRKKGGAGAKDKGFKLSSIMTSNKKAEHSQ